MEINHQHLVQRLMDLASSRIFLKLSSPSGDGTGWAEVSCTLRGERKDKRKPRKR